MNFTPHAAHAKVARNLSAYRTFCIVSGLSWAAERRRAILIIMGLFAVMIGLVTAAVALMRTHPGFAKVLFALAVLWSAGATTAYIILDELRIRRIRAEVAARRAATKAD